MRKHWLIVSAGLMSLAGLLECVGDTTTLPDSGGPDATNDTTVPDSGGDSPAQSDADAAKAPDPSTISAGNLQLWLTADRGVTCNTNFTPHRLSAWKDQSTHARDGIMPTVAPQCQVHSVNNIDVPYFSHPDAGSPYSAETINVDLAFLANTNYTILVVDQMLGLANGNTGTGLIGTVFSPENTNVNPNSGLNVGYETGLKVYADQNYNYLGDFALGGVPTKPSVNILWFDAAVGHRFYRDGTLAFQKTDPDSGGLAPIAAAVNGGIGRAAWYTLYDARYYGYIAEVVIYDAALTDPDRTALNAYAKAHWGL